MVFGENGLNIRWRFGHRDSASRCWVPVLLIALGVLSSFNIDGVILGINKSILCSADIRILKSIR